MSYNHYRTIRTQKPWRVPILNGRRPKLPDETSTADDKGRYAIFMMMLFRPWRDLDDSVDMWAGEALRSWKIDEIWDALFVEYLCWRRLEIIHVAWPFFDAMLSTSRLQTMERLLSYGGLAWCSCDCFTWNWCCLASSRRSRLLPRRFWASPWKRWRQQQSWANQQP